MLLKKKMTLSFLISLFVIALLVTFKFINFVENISVQSEKEKGTVLIIAIPRGMA